MSRTSAEEDEVSMDELRAVEAAFDSDSSASTSKPKSAEGIVEEHVTLGVVTSAERVVKTTPIAITSGGGTVQDDLSGSGSHVERSLLDSSPSTRHYVRRARRVSTTPITITSSGGILRGLFQLLLGYQHPQVLFTSLVVLLLHP